MSSAKKILIVEDEKILQDVFKLILESRGYEVHTADDGLQGVGMFKKIRPHLVLLDVFMPVMDGREFLRNIDLAEYKDTDVVVCSNLSNRDVEIEMLELGAKEFVLKSTLAPTDLLTLVSRYITK